MLLAGKADRTQLARLQFAEENAIHGVFGRRGVDKQLRLRRARTLQLLARLFAALIVDQQNLAVLETVDAVDAQTKPQPGNLVAALLFDRFNGEWLTARRLDAQPVEDQLLQPLPFGAARQMK